ncbi:MAG TPA: class I SAM-dependent methyltransferase [Solirubrobacterales bacterium]
MKRLIAPNSGPAEALHRAVMWTQARRLAGRSHPRAALLSAALQATALGRMTAEERSAISRVEGRRTEIPFELATALGEDPHTANDPFASRLAHAWETCRWVSIPPYWGRFLFRLVRELRPRTSLELGTGFGLSALYQARALELDGDRPLTTLDFHYAAEIGERGFAASGLDERVELVFGDIDDTLPGVLERIGEVDYALLDAEHSTAATVRHFDAVLPSLAPGAIAVFDDITSTPEMREAWRLVIARERVTLAVPLRRFGVVAV